MDDYYYKFTPDSIVISIPAHGTTYSDHYYSLDINHDGIMDFQFALLAPSGALGQNTDHCLITGLNNNDVAFARYDTCFNNGGVYGSCSSSIGMAYAFHYNDTINSNANWQSLGYLSYYFMMMGTPTDSSACYCNRSYSSDTAYLGVRIKVDSSFEYGWIKIVGTSFSIGSATTLTMGEYACQNWSLGEEEIIKNASRFSLFPNPASNTLTIETPSPSTIKISTIQDQLIKTIATNGSKINVDHVGYSSYVVNVSAWPDGVYLVEVRTEKGIAVKKFIKE